MSDQPKPTGEAEPIRVGPSWVTCEKCSEEYNTSSIHVCKPTGEWTGDDDGVLLPMHRFVGKYAKEIADAHNAALRNAQPFLDNALKQLAAEREKVQTLVDDLKEVRSLVTPPSRKIAIIDSALAKVAK